MLIFGVLGRQFIYTNVLVKTYIKLQKQFVLPTYNIWGPGSKFWFTVKHSKQKQQFDLNGIKWLYLRI